MSLWFAAHLLLYAKQKECRGGKTRVWENIVLIKAGSEKEAFAKAAERGKADEGDDDGTFRWGGKPARWVFAGVRKLTLCEDPERRPGDGTEVSYTEFEVASEQAVAKLLDGKPVLVKSRDTFREWQTTNGARSRVSRGAKRPSRGALPGPGSADG
jgi:hypothetical protein